MILLADILAQFEAQYLEQYGHTLLPSQRQALARFQVCRNAYSAQMELTCSSCPQTRYVPHSCGHRHCPHCQAHESQRWIERQMAKQLPCTYYMLTFTLPKEWRQLAWQQQKTLYQCLTQCAWETVNTFSQNDKHLQGSTGAVTVLHTHTRQLDYHPHVHLVMPAGALDPKQNIWRSKKGKYLFNHKALAKVFRAKMHAALKKQGLAIPDSAPEKWVVDCKNVGAGDKAIAYLGRYLYRGVIQEKDILTCKNGMISFRYQDSKTKATATRTVTGVEFIRLIMQHILPKGFRRARNHGLLHPNSKSKIARLHIALHFQPKPHVPTPRKNIVCTCCGSAMTITRTGIRTERKNRGTTASVPEVVSQPGSEM